MRDIAYNLVYLAFSQCKQERVKMDNEFMLGGWSYQKKFRYCNKPVCKCHDGQPHGPYWYRSRDGQLQYVGKLLPAYVVDALQCVEISRPDAQAVIQDLNKAVQDQERLLSSIREKISALRIALSGGSLTPHQGNILREMSFASLVPSPLLSGEQLKLV